MAEIKNILYVSCLCSAPMMHHLFDTAEEKPHPAPQKYHSLMVKGIVANGGKVASLVALPVTVRSHPNKKWWGRKDEFIDGVHYIYIPFYNQPYIKFICFKIYAFFFSLNWAMHHKKNGVMICDVLTVHSSASAIACRILGVKTVGIVTDIPGMLSEKKRNIFQQLYNKYNINIIRRMSGFIPLTDAMCDIINPNRKKPYVVIEGLVDSTMEAQDPIIPKDGKRHITYTGTLDARYGVRTLIEAFMMLTQKDILLDIYGKGPMEKEIPRYVKEDSRIRFHGMVPIEEAVKAQRSSFLLVNPRPTKEEFTKYSFPSKNMEYMVTGVPLLTAVLPGMPKEYYPYVFLFEDESSVGITQKLHEILTMPESLVHEKGYKGKAFVLKNKNNISQAQQMMSLIKFE